MPGYSAKMEQTGDSKYVDCHLSGLSRARLSQNYQEASDELNQ